MSRKRRRYIGMTSAENRAVHKYRKYQWVIDGSRRIRLLSADEIDEFRAHVQRCIDSAAEAMGGKRA